jgi:hypothetical protein
VGVYHRKFQSQRSVRSIGCGALRPLRQELRLLRIYDRRLLRRSEGNIPPAEPLIINAVMQLGQQQLSAQRILIHVINPETDSLTTRLLWRQFRIGGGWKKGTGSEGCIMAETSKILPAAARIWRGENLRRISIAIAVSIAIIVALTLYVSYELNRVGGGEQTQNSIGTQSPLYRFRVHK